MYRYYPALQATDGYQALPRPLYLHNDNADAITLNIKPFPENSVIAPFAATNTNVLPGLTPFSPELKAAQSATEYDATALNGIGTGAKITTTVTESPDGTIGAFPASATSSGAVAAAPSTTYKPTTDGAGTNFEVTFTQSGVGAFNPTSVTIVNAGSGYVVGDELTFVVGGLTTVVTLVTDNFNTGFFITTAVSSTVGKDYANGDVVAITLEETVDAVVYQYEALFTVSNAMLESAGAIPLKLNVGETSVVPALAFQVQGNTDKSVLALLAAPI
jgi:hypothetical protein